MISSTSTYGTGLSNESKLTAHITSLTYGKRLLQQEPIFTQNDNKTRGMSSHLWLMVQVNKSLWGNFGSRGLEGKKVCSAKLQRFKVDKRDMLLGMSSPTL